VNGSPQINCSAVAPRWRPPRSPLGHSVSSSSRSWNGFLLTVVSSKWRRTRWNRVRYALGYPEDLGRVGMRQTIKGAKAERRGRHPESELETGQHPAGTSLSLRSPGQLGDCCVGFVSFFVLLLHLMVCLMPTRRGPRDSRRAYRTRFHRVRRHFEETHSKRNPFHDLDELDTEWRAANEAAATSEQREQLIAATVTGQTALGQIFRRDLKETFAAVFVIIFFGRYCLLPIRCQDQRLWLVYWL